MLSVLLLMQKDPQHGSHCPEDSLLVLKREGRGSAWRAEGLPSAQHPLDTGLPFPLGGVSLSLLPCRRRARSRGERALPHPTLLPQPSLQKGPKARLLPVGKPPSPRPSARTPLGTDGPSATDIPAAAPGVESSTSHLFLLAVQPICHHIAEDRVNGFTELCRPLAREGALLPAAEVCTDSLRPLLQDCTRTKEKGACESLQQGRYLAFTPKPALRTVPGSAGLSPRLDLDPRAICALEVPGFKRPTVSLLLTPIAPSPPQQPVPLQHFSLHTLPFPFPSLFPSLPSYSPFQSREFNPRGKRGNRNRGKGPRSFSVQRCRVLPTETSWPSPAPPTHSLQFGTAAGSQPPRSL